MSHLIQNINHKNYTMRLNLRIRSMWFSRNSSTISVVLLSLIKNLTFVTTVRYDALTKLYISKYIFVRFAKIVCLSSKYLQQVTFGIHFPKSAHYAGCLYIKQTLSKETFDSHIWPRNNLLYNTPIAIITTPRTCKLLKCIIYQVFKYWLNVWVSISHTLTLPHSFVCVPDWWQLVNFTNVFYLKVYNT